MSRKIPTGSTKGRRISFDEEKIEDFPQKEGKYKIRLPSKSRSDMYSIVLKIINNYTNWYEDNLLYVSFNEPNDDLKKVIEISKEWKAFGFFVDNEEIRKFDIHQVQYILYCRHKDECNGICRLFGFYDRYRIHDYKTIFDLINILNSDSQNDISDFEKLGILLERSWVEIEKDNERVFQFAINNDKLVEEALDRLDDVIRYCQIIKVEDIKKKILKIPNKITIMKSEELLEEYSRLLDNDGYDTHSNLQSEPLRAIITEEQMDLLAKKIGKEIEIVLKKLMKNKK